MKTRGETTTGGDALAPLCVIATRQDFETAFEFSLSVLPEGRFKKIIIKPNWVKHQEHLEFPITSLVTDSRLIEAVIDACIAKYPSVEEITVGDVPLQTCNWEMLAEQIGLDHLSQKYAGKQPLVRFYDLRRERFDSQNGYHVQQSSGSYGDPNGYREAILGSESFLEPVSETNEMFRVSDYDPKETTSSHSLGIHKYLIAGSVLDCDLLINLPKLKTHQKTGVTGALKNLVGVNGNKAFLVHYKRGRPANGGDEFPPNISRLIVLQTRIREALQKRSRILFRILRPFWLLMKKVGGIATEGTPANLSKTFYIGGGSWYGNDTIWRMVYDLNKIIRYLPRVGGKLSAKPERTYIAIMDGLTAGEGNGPLQPLPVDLGVLIASRDPFLVDLAMSKIIGFDYRKIPMLANHRMFQDSTWGNFDPDTVRMIVDNEPVEGIGSVPTLRCFLPPPGWRGKLELTEEAVSLIS